MGLVDFQEVAENTMAWAHYHLTTKEEAVEGSKNEEGLVGTGYIHEGMPLWIKVSGTDRMDRFHMLVRKGGHLA